MQLSDFLDLVQGLGDDEHWRTVYYALGEYAEKIEKDIQELLKTAVWSRSPSDHESLYYLMDIGSKINYIMQLLTHADLDV